jgi:nitrite reductase/ring-hydroxylating ferredoxin subunit
MAEENKPDPCRDNVDRRAILREAGTGLLEHRCRGHGGAFAYQFLSPNVLYEPSPIVNAGKPDRYPLDSVTLDVNTGIYLIHSQEGYFALSAVCTHLGCLTAWKPELGIIACPCHGSKFTRDGRKDRRPRTQAPAVEAHLAQRRRRSSGGPLHRRSSAAAGFLLEGVSMAKTFDQYFEDLRGTRVWRSIFRSGAGSSTLHRALAIQQNVFLHLFSTKVRTRMLSFSATWYLGTLTLGTFFILVATGIPFMLYYHPIRAAGLRRHEGFAVRGLLRTVSAQFASLVGARHGFPGLRAYVQGFLSRRLPHSARVQLGDWCDPFADDAAAQLHRLLASLGPTGLLGNYGRIEYRFCGAGHGRQDSFPDVGRARGQRQRAAALLCAALHDSSLTAMFFVAIHFWRIRKDGGLYSHASEPATLRANASAVATTAKEAQ